ncbi:GNAT family N-acetyltransferase [Flammeovirga pectinis]|uniref:GNAT family N-acetyltransferase n=1 Tax=Flammeovirga pectinis TaxID=2494373 RepID=A0A3Q9FSP5_9BACT|nr:GNAT family N-acetyltransferase [Flammeovirga pectinis]AZQ65066.1 GNAT family N-acetyltransferase [Flammeovirga pectinis]
MNIIEQIDLNFKLHAVALPKECNLMQVFSTDNINYIDSGLEADTFNVIHLEKTDSISKNELEKILNFYENRLRKVCIWIESSKLNTKTEHIFSQLSIGESGINKGMYSSQLDKIRDVEDCFNIYQVDNKQDIIDHAFVIANNWDPFDINILHYYDRTSTIILTNKNNLLFNYKEDNVIVGVIELFIEKENPKNAGIYNLSVMKENRRKGIGSKLIQHAMKVAHQKGVELLLLQASDYSANLFLKEGFKVQGEFIEFCKK